MHGVIESEYHSWLLQLFTAATWLIDIRCGKRENQFFYIPSTDTSAAILVDRFLHNHVVSNGDFLNITSDLKNKFPEGLCPPGHPSTCCAIIIHLRIFDFAPVLTKILPCIQK